MQGSILNQYLNLITLNPREGSNYAAHWSSNNKYIGDFVQEVDGFFVFYPSTDIRSPYTEAHVLAIGAKLSEINEEWKEELSKIPEPPQPPPKRIIKCNGLLGSHETKESIEARKKWEKK